MRNPHFLSLALISLFALAGCAGEVGSPDSDEDDATKTSPLAGAFDDYGGGARKEGQIFEMSIRKDGTFLLAVEGVYGCSTFKGSGYQGYDCPSSWSDGYAGWTAITGTYKSVKGGLKLQPTGAVGKPSDPFTITMSVTGAKAEVDGTIPGNRPITGKLDVQGLLTKKHSVEDKDLDGTWLVDSPMDKDGDQSQLSGTQVYVKGMKHFVRFDSKKHTYAEWRSDSRPKSIHDVGPWTVVGATDGAGEGRVVLEDSVLFDMVTIKSLDGDKLKLTVSGGRTMSLVRQPK